MIAKLKAEPVAFWGGLVAAALAVMGYLGVSADIIALVGTVATALGIPLVRSQVSPTITLKKKVTVMDNPDAGQADLLLLIAILLGVVLLLFGVQLGR